MKLGRLIASGTHPSYEQEEVTIRTNSGFTVLAYAHEGCTCTPLVSECSEKDVYEGEDACGHCQEDDDYEKCNYPGPYTHVCVYAPSERPEPWDKWKKYLRYKHIVADPNVWKISPFDFVPVAMLVALIKEHGDEISGSTF